MYTNQPSLYSGRYSRMLEEGPFHGRTADFFWLYVLICVSLLASLNERVALACHMTCISNTLCIYRSCRQSHHRPFSAHRSLLPLCIFGRAAIRSSGSTFSVSLPSRRHGFPGSFSAFPSSSTTRIRSATSWASQLAIFTTFLKTFTQTFPVTMVVAHSRRHLRCELLAKYVQSFAPLLTLSSRNN